MKIAFSRQKPSHVRIRIPLKKEAVAGGAALGGALSGLLNFAGSTVRGGGELIGEVAEAIPELADLGITMGVGLPLALPPALAAGAGAATALTGKPGKMDFERLRKKELLEVLNRLTAQASQRARQLRGEQD